MHYSLNDGLVRRRLSLRILLGTINVLAVFGWLLALMIIITIVTGTFDDLLIIIWEATA